MRAGEVILVTDRGRVVAELRQPLHEEAAAFGAERGLARLAEAGRVRLGAANRPGAYPPSPLRTRPGLVERLIDEDRPET